MVQHDLDDGSGRNPYPIELTEIRIAHLFSTRVMSMGFVCDTNVWYDISTGTLDPANLKRGGNRLLAPAINALELSSNLDDQNLTIRQKASKAVLSHADEHLQDPERHIGAIWGLNLPPLGFDWRDVYRTINASANVTEVVNGTQNIMKVSASTAKAWRKGFTEQFVKDIEAAIRTFAPKYALRRQSGRMDYLTDPAAISKLSIDLRSAAVLESQILTTRLRASTHAASPPPPPNQAETELATPKLMPFVKAYLTLIEKAATVHAVHPNDWGDLHCFVYLQGNRKLLTGENKWLTIARDAGIGNLVQDSKAI
jgi:hypothetical protein